MVTCSCFNPLPKDNFLDWTNIKAFADDKLTVADLMICVFDMKENIVGKGENAGYQHFLTTFSKDFFLEDIKSRHCVAKSSCLTTYQK